ncbi:MAG TPA: KH domain-containing protein [Thermoplasmata archaeon]|nr:KH domain-containing protein [Thermoplasmata archaeon]
MLYARMPMERIGVLVGPKGETKQRLEEATGTKVLVDSETGEVSVDESHAADPSLALKARDIVTAVGRGFSEERAFRLLDEDAYLQVLEIKDYARSRGRIAQVKARLIGSRGKTRRILEEMTGADVSVYGHTVAVIAASYQLPIAVEALEMLLRGSEHSTVYRYLERKREELRVYEMGF